MLVICQELRFAFNMHGIPTFVLSTKIPSVDRTSSSFQQTLIWSLSACLSRGPFLIEAVETRYSAIVLSEPPLVVFCQCLVITLVAAPGFLCWVHLCYMSKLLLSLHIPFLMVLAMTLSNQLIHGQKEGVLPSWSHSVIYHSKSGQASEVYR